MVEKALDEEFWLLDEEQKALLKWDIVQAKKAKFCNGHRRMSIHDPMRKFCSQ